MPAVNMPKTLNRSLLIAAAVFLLGPGAHAAGFGGDPQADARAMLAAPTRTVTATSSRSVPEAQEQARRLLAHDVSAPRSHGVRTAAEESDGRTTQTSYDPKPNARRMILGRQG